MLNTLFSSIFDTTASTISISTFLWCIIASIIAGILIAVSYSFKSKYSKGFLITLAMLPMLVSVVIMMVNGNIGAGVAVAGAFSLVRFRSNPGTAKEIGSIFGAMAIGLITGMGYIGYALLFTLIFCLVLLCFETIGSEMSHVNQKILTIAIPESINYTEVFDEVFDSFTSEHKLMTVKTSNMGSIYKLTYEITENDITKEKDMIDALRCRNGNLEISISYKPTPIAEL